MIDSSGLGSRFINFFLIENVNTRKEMNLDGLMCFYQQLMLNDLWVSSIETTPRLALLLDAGQYFGIWTN